MLLGKHKAVKKSFSATCVHICLRILLYSSSFYHPSITFYHLKNLYISHNTQKYQLRLKIYVTARNSFTSKITISQSSQFICVFVNE